MLFKISWRNIWRNPLRSLVVMGSIMVGTWSIISLLSFSSGMVKSYVNNAIRMETSHLQLHDPIFKAEDQEITAVLPEAEARLAAIKERPEVNAATVRTLVNGMLVAPKGTRGVLIKGIEEEAEAQLTEIDQQITEGDYFGKGKNQVLMGKELADKLGLKLRKKIVLQFQSLEGEITAGAFRIVGLIDSGNKLRDGANVFVRRSDLNRLLGQEDAAHEIAVFLQDPAQIGPFVEDLRATYPTTLVETYQELSPDIKLYETQIGASFAIFVGIFMLALIFGIINTMLMAVLERTRELGMLMSVGMNKFRVFGMIVIETVMLGVLSATAGILLGWLSVQQLSEVGLDLSSFSQGLKQFGMSTIVYPHLDPNLYVQLAIAVLITTLLASLYPAYKAISLRPVEAVRKI